MARKIIFVQSVNVMVHLCRWLGVVHVGLTLVITRSIIKTIIRFKALYESKLNHDVRNSNLAKIKGFRPMTLV